jgi:glycosyltransferase involved in cell wall biosynthesis
MRQVDVVVPCYNYGRFLETCVKSVLAQRGVDVRVLIVDDCSQDDTPAIASSLAEGDRRVEYRRHPANRGHIETYNEGVLQWASAAYTLLLDADDVLTPGAAARAVHGLDQHPTASFCCGRQQVFSEEAELKFECAAESSAYHITSGLDFWRQCFTAGVNPVATPTAFVRTEVLQREGGYRPFLPHAGDLDLWLRLSAHGPVIVLEALQAYKRQHDHAMHLAYVKTCVPDLEQRLLAFESAADSCRPLMEGVDELVTTARQALSREALWAAAAAFDRREGDTCRQTLELARRLDASVVQDTQWNRLKWKQRLGPNASLGLMRLRSTLDRWRRMRASSDASD